jgi:hypothetical protein
LNVVTNTIGARRCRRLRVTAAGDREAAAAVVDTRTGEGSCDRSPGEPPGMQVTGGRSRFPVVPGVSERRERQRRPCHSYDSRCYSYTDSTLGWSASTV